MSLTNHHSKMSGRGDGTVGPLLCWLLLLPNALKIHLRCCASAEKTPGMYHKFADTLSDGRLVFFQVGVINKAAVSICEPIFM